MTIILGVNVNGQNKELFNGENLFSECRVNLPLTYKNKDKVICGQAAKDLRDIKLVLLHYDKKRNIAIYNFYYVDYNDSKDEIFVYLEPVESHFSTSDQKISIFPEYSPKKDRFYKADCFVKILNKNKDLKKIIRENK